MRYELIKGHGELFRVSRKTGDIELKQNLEGHSKEYHLLVAAYDGGNQPCRTDIPVTVKVIDSSMPVFKKQVYTDSIPENVEIGTPLAIILEAESAQNRKLIYAITDGNSSDNFELDFNNDLTSFSGPCLILVAGELDFETKAQYELQIRATDPISGMFAEVPVYIQILDVNDCKPEFSEDNFNISVSENTSVGSQLLSFNVKDNDTGKIIKLHLILGTQKLGSKSCTQVAPKIFGTQFFGNLIFGYDFLLNISIF